jgi:hypothetical protein
MGDVADAHEPLAALHLSPAVQRALEAAGLTRLTATQADAIRLGRWGADVLVHGPSRSGKTAAAVVLAMEGLRERGAHAAPELQALYAETGKTSAVFITAFNPEGALQADALNQAAHEALMNALSALTGLLFEGEGRGTQDNAGWPAEKSFLALGIDREESARLGRQFRQDAVVRTGPDGVPELLLLR